MHEVDRESGSGEPTDRSGVFQDKGEAFRHRREADQIHGSPDNAQGRDVGYSGVSRVQKENITDRRGILSLLYFS